MEMVKVIVKPKWTETVTVRYGKYNNLIEKLKELKSTQAVVVDANEAGRAVKSFCCYVKAKAKKAGCNFTIQSHYKEDEKSVYFWRRDNWK